MFTNYVEGYTHHPYHIINSSSWPFGCSLAFNSALYYFLWYQINNIKFISFYALNPLSLVFYAYFWWKDVEKESSYEGYHDSVPHISLRIGVLLFIVSEVMFFFSFFWAFFHFSLSPAPEINIWPPLGIEAFDFTCLPLLNTLLLILSGSAITYAHHTILSNPVPQSVLVKIIICVLACSFLFTFLQAQEYYQAPFDISDSSYGSIFFLATGFHGIHVILGSFLIVYNLLRFTARNNFSKEHHFGVETAIWYWHFVDIVWLFLFAFIYCWGS